MRRLDGRPLAALRRTRLWRTVQTTPSRAKFPGGESIAAMQLRATTAIEELAERHGERRGVVVSHADVIKALLVHHLGAPLDMMQRLVILPLSLSRIDLDPGKPTRVHAVNSRGLL